MGTDVVSIIGHTGIWEEISNLPAEMKKWTYPKVKDAFFISNDSFLSSKSPTGGTPQKVAFELMKEPTKTDGYNYLKIRLELDDGSHTINVYPNMMMMSAGWRLSQFVKTPGLQKEIRSISRQISKYFNQPYCFYFGDWGSIYEYTMDKLFDGANVNEIYEYLKENDVLFPINEFDVKPESFPYNEHVLLEPSQ